MDRRRHPLTGGGVPRLVGPLILLCAGAACRANGSPGATVHVPPVPGGMQMQPLGNRYAYIPPQCYAITQDTKEAPARNACYACHIHSIAPNFVDDAELQLAFTLPAGAAPNPWRNLLDPPAAHARRLSDPEVLAYVRASNYFDAGGQIALARRLAALPPEWDGQQDGRWDGFVPDAWFRFDERGFDHAPDGHPTGWRAFAYSPFLGAFFPTNGSMDDVLIRLDPSLREDAGGRADADIYRVNLALVEALISRADVSLDPAIDERALGADIDLDGTLGRATRVAFRAGGGMRYVGRARDRQAKGELPLEPGLFPLGTEFLHSVRYMDVGPDGEVAMAPRMKELRYTKKVRWMSSADLRAHAASEATEQAESADGVMEFLWQFDRGVYNNQGWLLQGFIEAADGSLRPQSYEESVVCAGCHGEVGATTDSIFSFARKLGTGAPAAGWFHWTQRGLRGLPEPRRRDGRYEYSLYLEAAGGGDDFHENDEVRARFFDDRGALRPDAVARLHDDAATLLVPSASRALDLDRAYLAIVREQAFVRGRDAVLAPVRHVHRQVPIASRTGVGKPLAGPATPAEL